MQSGAAPGAQIGGSLGVKGAPGGGGGGRAGAAFPDCACRVVVARANHACRQRAAPWPGNAAQQWRCRSTIGLSIQPLVAAGHSIAQHH